MATEALAKMVEVDEASLQALRTAIANDDVNATEVAMKGATDRFAPGGIPHERKTWDEIPRGEGCGITHSETPYCDETYDGGAEYAGNLENDNDDGRHHMRVYTVLHHAVHCKAHKVIQWAIDNGADVSLPSTWKLAQEDHEFLASHEKLQH